jgi:hypothetical protein
MIAFRGANESLEKSFRYSRTITGVSEDIAWPERAV